MTRTTGSALKGCGCAPRSPQRWLYVMRPVVSVLLALSAWFFSDVARSQTSIGVVQYNVKHGQGGWTDEFDVMRKQIDIIATAVKENAVDFVSLEQAGSIDNQGQIISESLRHAGLPGWSTITSACNRDVMQLAYSSNWQLVVDDKSKNPLLDGLSHQRGWIKQGCDKGGNGRPYNVAYFLNKQNRLRLCL
jgi:hypothetical protein